MRAYSTSKDLHLRIAFDKSVNEDAVKATEKWIAVSDGAGGGGVFADKWSRYLVDHLPDEPMTTYDAFDKWLDSIWEPFYNEYEEIAKKEGGMLLNKFYDEGSFATLVVVWRDGHWLSYGDSVAFCYNRSTGKLQHTFGKIVDFNNPPYLINCKDATMESAFKSGRFHISDSDVVFAASDALAHYIIMMYEVAHKDWYGEELLTAINAQTKNSNLVRTAMAMKKKDFNDRLTKLVEFKNKSHFRQHLQKLYRDGLLGHDDYSLAIM